MTFEQVREGSGGRSGRARDRPLMPAGARGIGPVADLRQVQAAVGNRAMRQVLARLAPADTKLDESESVLQPPMSWVKYPPLLLMMTRIELFDAIELLNQWLPKHDHYVTELRALREDLRGAGHQLTTPTEYSTLSHWVKLPKRRLREAYDVEVQRVIADRRELTAVSFDVIDEVVRDRFPNEKWPAAARAWLDGYLQEEDRRSERLSKLAWYERDTFEKFDGMSGQLAGAGQDLFRELAWQWIDLRDAGQDRTKIEDQLIDQLGGLYEHLLHEIDGLIQKECAKHHPDNWRERLQENLYKAWGDPCKPWFGPEGTHGPDELEFFQLRLRLQRQGTPFSVVYWWVKEYLKAEGLLTDPKAQLAQLRSQAVVGLFTHWAMLLEFSPQIADQARELAAEVRGLGTFIMRKGSSFLRHTMLGYRLALGDLGGSGAEVGGVSGRPAITAVSGASGGGGARPPVGRGSDMPDPPTRAPTRTTTTTTTTTTPAGGQAGHRTTATPAPDPLADLPPSTASKWTPSPAPKTPDPPPQAFTKAKDLKFPSPNNVPPTKATVKQAVLDKFKANNLKSGTDKKDLPNGWEEIFEHLKQALRQNTDNASKLLLDVLDTVWSALRNPELYAEVISTAWEQAVATGRSIDMVLVSMAETSSGQKSAWIPQHLREWLLAHPGAFFDLYGGQPVPFVDMPLMGTAHGGLTHLLQDLVVNLGLIRAKKSLTSFQVRKLLLHIPGKIRPMEFPGGPTVQTGGKPEMRIGDYVWQLTYDLFVNAQNQFPQPEAVGKALQELLDLR